MKTNLFKSLLVAAMAVGAMGGVNAQTTTAFSQDFTAKTSESGVVSTDPADYGFTKLNFVGNYTVANITDGKFTTKVGGTDRSHTENGTVEYCANFDAIGKGNIVTISFIGKQVMQPEEVILLNLKYTFLTPMVIKS